MKENIQDLIYKLELEKEKQEKIFKETIKSLNNLIYSVQKICDHSETIYFPDASGNNDSCYGCLICGIEKKKF